MILLFVIAAFLALRILGYRKNLTGWKRCRGLGKCKLLHQQKPSSNVNDLTFSSPDLSSFCQLNNLGLVATGQHLCAEYAVIEYRFTKAPEPCPKCAAAGVSRGTIDRHLAHTPYGQQPTTLLLRIRRWRCACGCFWHEDTSSAASPRSKLSHRAIRWGLAALVLDDLSISRIAKHLGVAWHTVNNAIINEGPRLLLMTRSGLTV